MGKFTRAMGKIAAGVKGAVHTTRKSVVRTVDVAKQKSAIAHKQASLQEMYESIGKYICTSCNDGTLRLHHAGASGSIAFKDQITEFLVLEAEFKDELERMEKMLHWLQTHEVKVNTSPVTEEAPQADAPVSKETEAVEEASEPEAKVEAEEAAAVAETEPVSEDR